MLDIMFFTDAHFWNDEQLPITDQVCTLIEREKPKTLIISEWFDPWKLPWPQILETKCWARFRKMTLYRSLDCLETIVIPGNHEIPWKAEYFPHCKIMAKYQNGNLVIMHGHQFDPIWSGSGPFAGISPVAFWIADHMSWMMSPIYRMLFGRPKVSLAAKKHTEADDWTEWVGVYQLRAKTWAHKNKVELWVGHDHCQIAPDGIFADAGDLEDSMTYLAKVDGKSELRTL